jgi:hypothetical protein
VNSKQQLDKQVFLKATQATTTGLTRKASITNSKEQGKFRENVNMGNDRYTSWTTGMAAMAPAHQTN